MIDRGRSAPVSGGVAEPLAMKMASVTRIDGKPVVARQAGVGANGLSVVGADGKPLVGGKAIVDRNGKIVAGVSGKTLIAGQAVLDEHGPDGVKSGH